MDSPKSGTLGGDTKTINDFGVPVDEEFNQSMTDSAYDNTLGTKLKLVHPVNEVKEFLFRGATGAIQVELAKFGRFQTGTSIQAQLFAPPEDFSIDGCSDLIDFDADNNMNYHGFVILMDGGCTYEEKARKSATILPHF